ncbi:hypothetical protein EP331_01995 [bacterium]|nr:MAG: hypothetical protein EP331_01995 [bacterium]
MKLGVIIWLILGVFATSDSVETVKNELKGSFVISERPDDFKTVLVWTQTDVKIDGISGVLLFHERATVRTLDKPYNQQVWALSKKDDGILLQHYDLKSIKSKSEKKSITKEDLIPLKDMDMMLKQNGDTWSGHVEFTNPEYLSRFVQQGTSAYVSLSIRSNEISYHLKIMDKDGKQIYGPKEKGYTLKRNKDL